MREEIIKMAREAGCIPRRHPEYWDDVQVFATPDVLERFFHMAQAAEREACAKVVDAAKADEEDWDSNDWNQAVEFCASRIRARGQT